MIRMQGAGSAGGVPAVLSAAAAVTVILAAQVIAAPPDTGREQPRFLRVVSEKERSVALEVAARSYTRDGAPGHRVVLVGAVHIGNESYYRLTQKVLDACDAVLYESVKPAGAGGAGGDDDEERIASTQAALEFLAGVAATCRERDGAYPRDVDALRRCAQSIDPRLPGFVDAALTDGWGRAVLYECCRVVGDGGEPAPRVMSLGADGKRGGEGAAADLEAEYSPEPLMQRDEGVNLQGELAAALGLAFQLDAVDYGRADWRCSDMSIDQVQRELDERGLDFTLVEETLAGSSLPAKIIKFLLGVIRLADALTEGAASDTIKVLLIEMLGDESLIESSLDQLGEGFAEVLIDHRNQVVVDDLKGLMERDEAPASVGVFYGAGHMPDLEQRLCGQLGYRAGGVQWLRAIEVDLTQSAVSQAEVARLRLMVRRMMRQLRDVRQGR